MNGSKKVSIIMSTYNGEKYIRELLDSLVRQENVSINLIVRDDGSKDKTVHILEEYADCFDALEIVTGENLRATKSFFAVAEYTLQHFDTSDYYAFCDQDDIWHPNKLKTAIEHLKDMPEDKPALYFSNLMMVNETGKEQLGYLLNNKVVSTNKQNAMAAIYTYGCTCVFNKKALEKFCLLDYMKIPIFHDNWMLEVCSFLGNVVYDPESYIAYRQTGVNESGEKKRGIALWMRRIQKIFAPAEDLPLYETIAKELLRLFSQELDFEDVIFLNKIANYRNKFATRISLIFNKRMKTKSHGKNFCIAGRILLGRL